MASEERHAAARARGGPCEFRQRFSANLRDPRRDGGTISLEMATLVLTSLALRVPPPRMAASSPIGFIGIGIMGDGMARCLLGAGCELVVWNRREEKSKALQAEAPAAVKIAATPADVVRACERTYVMLPTPEACAEVYSMSGGILEGVTTGKAVIDCATLEPSDMERLDALVTGAGGRFAEAPVSGSKGLKGA